MPEKNNDDPTQTIETLKKGFITASSGMLTGVAIAGIFHPWDRGLYLAITNNRSFLYSLKNNKFVFENFSQPYQGFLQTVFSRAFSNGIYFVTQNQANIILYPYLRHNYGLYDWQAQLGVGLTVGSITGVTTNCLYAIRSQTWNSKNSTFFHCARKMWSEGGTAPFIKGITATVCRDITFGIVYEVLRHLGHNEKTKKHSGEFIHNAAAAGVATFFSGPFNYVRNIQYSTTPDTPPPKMKRVLLGVWQESKSQGSLLARFSLFPNRFKIGAGTVRVALGMGTGQYLYETCQNLLENKQLSSK